MSRFAKALEGGAENLTLAIADWMFNESLSADEGKADFWIKNPESRGFSKFVKNPGIKANPESPG